MKKVFLSLLCVVMLVSMVACSKDKKGAEETAGSSEEVVTLTGTAEGFGGPINVTVKKQGDKIISVEATGESETDGIGTTALEELPGKIVEANSTDVDVISSATITSQGIIDAVNNALESGK